MKEQRHKRIIISGGGTGGHIFPALSIAGALRSSDPGTEILFVGAEGRMEMEKVPAAGYPIKGLPVSGLVRRVSFENLKVLVRLLRSLRMAKRIIREFNPDVVVGVGGYASGPVLRVAGRLGIPTLIQEQNSYAGVTNRLLAKRAAVICVAYEGMERFFPAERIVFTGNPVRSGIGRVINRQEALDYFGLEEGKPVVLVLGGSLGSRTINESLLGGAGSLAESGYQVIWQTGRYYFERMVSEAKPGSSTKITAFIERMELAYGVSDIIVSRAGAGTISELCLVGKPVILVPSPNVAEDHQTSNARALVSRGAAIMVSDAEARANLVARIIETGSDSALMESLAAEIKKLAVGDADRRIAGEVFKLVR